MKVPRLESTTAFPIIPGYGEKEHGDGPVGPGNPRSLHWEGGEVQNILWTADQKFVYINGNDGSTQELAIWREAADGSSAAEKLAGGCRLIFDVEASGRFLLTLVAAGDKLGIYEYSLADRKCTPLLPGVLTFGLLFDPTGKSFLYAVAGHQDVVIYRQNWQDGKAIGQPQAALKLPFAFPLVSGGNAYDFSRDLSSIVYARYDGHADFYLLRQK